jgi:hypothetical protein
LRLAKEKSIMSSDVEKKTSDVQESYFRVTDSIPEQTWYWLALASIGLSAVLKVTQKDHWALFVGQWPPTFLLFGIFHRVTRLGK